MHGRKNRSPRRSSCLARAFGLLVLTCALAFAAGVLISHRNTSPVPPGPTSTTAPAPKSMPGIDRVSVQHMEPPADSSADVRLRQTPQRTAPPGKGRPKPGAFPSEFRRGSPNSRRIALTFDAGAGVGHTQQILDTLARNGLHATFFLTGKWAAANPGLTGKIAAAGHEIGNHTYTHRRLTKLSKEEIADELDSTEQLIIRLTGVSTKPLVRVPYGERDQRVISDLEELGYTSVYWDLDSWDSVKKGITSDEIEQRVLQKVRNGSVVLMHCGSIPTADALDSIIQKLRKAGYEPVRVGELMAGG